MAKLGENETGKVIKYSGEDAGYQEHWKGIRQESYKVRERCRVFNRDDKIWRGMRQEKLSSTCIHGNDGPKFRG